MQHLDLERTGLDGKNLKLGSFFESEGRLERTTRPICALRFFSSVISLRNFRDKCYWEIKQLTLISRMRS